MTETLWGVVIGGLIASITPLITLQQEYKKWRKEKKIEIFKNRQDKLRCIYDKALNSLKAGSESGSFSIDLWTDMDIVMPKKVSERCHEFMKEKDPDRQKEKIYFTNIAMKESLEDFDKKIENEVSNTNFMDDIFNFVKSKIQKRTQAGSAKVDIE